MGSGAGATVISTLYIPASATNNNTEVMCKVVDGTLTNVQTSNSSYLTVQGKNWLEKKKTKFQSIPICYLDMNYINL